MKYFSLLFLIVFSSCAQQKKDSIKLLPPQEFSLKMSNKHMQLVDVRTPSEWDKGMIDNAKGVDFWNDTFKDKILKLDKTLPIAVYCRSGRRSARAARLLHELGFVEIYDLEGGYLAWKDAM